eukprot:03619.XXX_39182_39328_1 [CDS] Oithona nana genome sequencing.
MKKISLLRSKGPIKHERRPKCPLPYQHASHPSRKWLTIQYGQMNTCFF